MQHLQLAFVTHAPAAKNKTPLCKFWLEVSRFEWRPSSVCLNLNCKFTRHQSSAGERQSAQAFVKCNQSGCKNMARVGAARGTALQRRALDPATLDTQQTMQQKEVCDAAGEHLHTCSAGSGTAGSLLYQNESTFFAQESLCLQGRTSFSR